MKADELIIYSDMDGTMLTDWSMGPYVPERNLAALRAFVAKGGVFSVASGRQYPDTVHFFPGVEINVPLVMSNGALIYDVKRKSVVQRTDLPARYKESALRFFMEDKRWWMTAGDELSVYQVLSGDRARDEALKDVKRKQITAEQYAEMRLTKVCFISPLPERLAGLRALADALPGADEVASAASSPVYQEYYAASVSKANGIRAAREYAGLTARTLVCIGDYYNDQEMLESADIAACPTNSAPGILDICPIHTVSNNDGAVADLIEKLYSM